MKFIKVPEELAFAVKQAAALLELEMVDGQVAFCKGEGMSVKREGDRVMIGYGSITDAMRGLSFAKRVLETGTQVSQKAKFETLAVMVDCSRNAVLNLRSAKTLMTQLAVMGFNAILFYTEDTYEIAEYPYFGHMRGRYTAEEMKELDDFGSKLGLEVIPCIQTLAHLNAIADWKCFAPYMDVDDILLADDERTYQLIEGMLKTMRSCFQSRRINIGMDEALLLGRGKHTDRFGYESKSDIMLRHLNRVVELCKKYDYEPIMWSDMFFRMQFDGHYRIKEGEISQKVLEKIPQEAALCYWEYYTNPHQTEATEHMFHCHRQTGRDVWFAGGTWTWTGFTPKNHFSLWITPAQLELAEKYNVQNIIATCWGDDGGECSIFSALPSLLQYAQLNYDQADDLTMENRSMDCFGISFSDFMKLDELGLGGAYAQDAEAPHIYEKAALYNDPMMGLMDWDVARFDLKDGYAKAAESLAKVADNRYSYLFETQYRLALLLDKKAHLSMDIKRAYREGNREELHRLATERIPEVIALLEQFMESFRFQWHWVNKPFGYEVQDIRLGGLKQRLLTAMERIDCYLTGEVERLEELEQADLPFNCDPEKVATHQNLWRRAATANIISHN